MHLQNFSDRMSKIQKSVRDFEIRKTKFDDIYRVVSGYAKENENYGVVLGEKKDTYFELSFIGDLYRVCLYSSPADEQYSVNFERIDVDVNGKKSIKEISQINVDRADKIYFPGSIGSSGTEGYLDDPNIGHYIITEFCYGAIRVRS